MLDINRIMDSPHEIEAALAHRGGPEFDFGNDIIPMHESHASLLIEVERLRHERNVASQRIGKHHSGEETLSEDEVEALKAGVRGGRAALQDKEAELRNIDQSLFDRMLEIPNVPADRAPVGFDYEDFELVDVWGDKPEIEAARDHAEIGKALGILNTEAGVAIAAPRFAFLRGKGAKLQRAIVNFYLDHNTDAGYEEHTVPYLVNEKALEGTGQFPKFIDDAFATTVGGRNMYLAPTAEVQLTNLFRDAVLDEEELPRRLTAYSENFRAEAGSAGRDMVGIFRQHQFPKIELVQVTHPEQSWEQLDELTFNAESMLRALGLHYRKVALSTGDLGFAAAFTYDLEVWLPGQENYREISSCSNFLDFQARRLNAKFQDAEGKKDYVHTINGSSLAIGRTIVAILEQGQQSDGSVVIPEALQDYTKFDKIEAA